MFFQKQKPKTIGYLRRQISLCLVLVFSVLLLSGLFSYTRGGAPEQAVAATSSNLNIQARLYSTSGNVVPDGYYNVEFKMYDALTSGSLLWTESWYDSNGVTAGNDNRVRIVNGYMSVQLGTHTALPSVNWDDNIYISLNIGGTTQTATPTYDGEMSPRIKLNSVPFAQAARNVQSGNTSAASTNSGNISIQTGNATGATSNSGNVTLDVGTATGTTGTISVGTANTSGITIGRVGVITAIDGQLTVSGTQFTNNGSTVNGVQSLGNFPTGGSIGSAASTVDVDTAFSITQTTAGQTISLPSPTVTTAGRIVYILNTGSASFTMEGVSIAAGYGQIYIWNGSSWRLGATGGSGTIALQAAYDGGNTIVTSDARNIDITLANTVTDANFLVNIATGSTGEFKIQNNGTDVLQIGSAGQLQLDTQGATGGILLGGDTNIYRSAANTLKTDDDFAVGNNITIAASTGNITTSGNITTTGTGTITSADDLAVNGDSITTDDTTFNLLNTTATTINAFGAATTLSLGAGSGTTTVNNNLTVTGLLTANGNLTIQNGDTFTVGGDAFTDLTGDGLIVSSNALTVDTTSATGFFRNGGNSFSGAATLGTNDANVLNLETANTNRFQVSASAATLTGQGATTIDSTGSLTVSSAASSSLNLFSGTDGELNIDSGTTGNINIGTSSGDNIISIGNSTGTSGVSVVAGTSGFSVASNDGITLAADDDLYLYGDSNFIYTNNDSATAFQVQNSLFASLFNIDASTGVVTVDNDLTINGGDLNSTATTFNLLQSTVTTLNIGGAVGAGGINFAGGSGSTGCTIDGSNGNLTCSGDVSISGGDLNTNQTTFNLLGSTVTTLNVGAVVGAGGINFAGGSGSTGCTIDGSNGNFTCSGDVAINGGDLSTNQTTFRLLNSTATTIDAFGAATAINIGASAGSTITGGGALTLQSGGTNTAFNLRNNGSGDINIGTNNTGLNNTIWIGNSDSAAQNIYIGASGVSASDQITLGNTGTVTFRSSGVYNQTNGNENRIVATTNATNTLNVRNSSSSTVFEVSTTGTGVTIADDLAINGGDLNSTATTFNLLQSTVTTLNIGGAVGAGGINFAGGSGSTGCTIDGSNGNLTCSGAITSTATSGTQGWWSRSGTTLQPANSGDNITTTGNISTTGTGTITSAGLLTASDDLAVNGDAITTDDTTFNLLNTTATTINAFGAASTINLGAAGATVTNPGSLNIRATGTNTLDLDTTGAGTIGLGDTNATTIGIGNTTAATAVTIQGGTSATAVNIQAAASGNINIGTNAVTGKVLNIGSVGSTNNNTTVNIANSSAAIQTVSIGSTSSSSATTIQGGTGGLNLSPSGSSNTGVIVRPTVSNSTAAFQIQNQAGTSTLFNADTTNMRVSVGTIGTATGQLYVAGRLPTTHTGTIATGTSPRSLYIQGKYAYVAHLGSATMQIYDISNPASPVSVSNVGTTYTAYSIYVQGRYAYLVHTSNSLLQIFDISNPASPVSMGTVATASNPYAVYVQGRYAYVAHFDGTVRLQIFDVSNPVSPVRVSSLAGSGTAYSVYVQGRYAYVTNFGDDTLRIIDVSNPYNPTDVGNIATGTDPESVYVQGRYAYVTNSGGTTLLQVFDISNPASPTSAGSLTLANTANSTYVQGRFAYLGIGSNGFQVVDISNPASPSSIGTLGTSSLRSVKVQGRYLYGVDQGSSVFRTYDLGGAYIQQLETGDVEASTLNVLNSASIDGNLSVQGGLTVLDSSNFSGGLSVGNIFDVTGSAAFRKGTDYSTTGSTNNVNFGEVSLVRLTGASAQTITGIANGRDGEILTIVNAAGQSATISNSSGSSSAGNQIITGTGANITLAAGGSITLVYDSASPGYWRVSGSVAFSTGNFIQNGTSQQTSANFNIKSASAGSVGAVIQGTTAQTADIFQLKDENNLNLLAVGANAGYAIQSSDGFTSTNAFTVGVVNSGVPTTIFGVNSTSPGVYTGSTTFSVFNTTATTINAFGAASTINLGAAGATVTNPGSLNIRATGTNTLDLDTTGAGTIGLGDTNATTIGIGNTTAATQTTIQGGTGTSAVNIQAGAAGDINIGTVNNNDLNINTAAVAGTTTIGGTGTTGQITIGQSTATNTISIGSAVPAGSATQTINIGNGSLSNASSSVVVNILSGAAGSNGTASLLMGNNDRVTQIDIGNVAADAARTLNFGTGNNTAAIDTLNIGTGNTTVAGGKTINIGTGTPTGSGTNVVTIGSLANASTTTIQGGTGAGGITLTATGSASTGVMVRNSTNSTAAFQIQNASSQSLFVADTTNQRLAVGPAAVPANGILTVGTNTTANTGGIFFGTDTNLYRYGAGQLASDGSVISTTGSFYTTAAGAGLIFGAAGTSGIINAGAGGTGDLYFYNGSGSPIATFSQTGTALFRNSTNSTVAFQIQSASGSDTMFIADTTTANKIKIGNSTGTGTSTTVFQLDAAASAPFGTGQTAYLGSMYYDSTQGKLQCYENRNGTAAWGACGSAPNNIITLTPEYTGAVLNGTGVGTLTADFCSNESGVLVVGSLCANHEARNFYKWTSPQGTDQTYSIFVTHKLPSTFSAFSDANTMKLTALTDSTTNANATLQVFRKNVSGNTIVSCGSATTINNTANTWQQTSFGGDETACGFTGGDYVIFRINVTAKSGGNVYVENLDFTYTNQ